MAPALAAALAAAPARAGARWASRTRANGSPGNPLDRGTWAKEQRAQSKARALLVHDPAPLVDHQVHAIRLMRGLSLETNGNDMNRIE